MKKILKIIILFTLFTDLYSAEKLSLTDCYKQVYENYPLRKQIKVQSSISDLKISNLNAKYLPELNFFGQAQYQSDVTKLKLDTFVTKFIQIPVLSKDQYKLGVSLDQLIWDGGIISNSKDIEETQSKINNKSIEVELYQLRQKVNDVYFSILLLKQRMLSLEIAKKDLDEKLALMKIKVANGVLLETNADILEAEIVKLEQSIEEIKSNIKSGFGILSELLNKLVSSDTELELPQAEYKGNDKNLKSRPEYQLYDLNKQNLNNSENLTETKYYPRFSLFGQAVYAKPGLNMFDPDFKPFYIVGLKASWNIWNWGSTGRDAEIIRLQKDIVSNQEETFSKNLSITMQTVISDIERLEKTIQLDEKIIEIRNRIITQTASQLDNGVITSTEYVGEFNASLQAKLNLDYHKLELVRAKVNYNTIVGKM